MVSVTEELIEEAKLFFDTYKKEIGDSVRKGRKVVFVNFDDLASTSPMLAEAIMSSPEEMLQLLETALEETGLIKIPRIRFNNLPETQKVKIRTIRANHLNKLIFFEGLVRQASEVRPQVVNAKFECPSCGTVISVLQIEKKFREPSRCSCGRKGAFRLISKIMVDAQRLVIEESPESLTGGEQPRRMNVFLNEDMVEPIMEEKTTPGSKVRVLGILKEVPVPLPSGSISTRFDLAIEANNVIPLETTYEELDITEEDERQIQELAEDPEVFRKLRESIAPSIWGYEEIKEALVLQMFGGVRKISDDGTVSRGDIHLFLIGDPGVAKSVTLKFISNIAPKGRYIVGKAATGAGITATVIKDEFLKGWSLEAGAMVLANKGIICIDEIEKMDPQDRSAMHEALEQQTVTISKANVQATLRAETSVLAAGNPKFGRFEPTQSITEQIDLPPTLINRFDLIFILRDLPNKDQDNAIATHVLNMHQMKGVKPDIDIELFKKYIAFAKQKIFPKLTEDAVNEIKGFYVKMRRMSIEGESRSISISARQLQGLVRLAEAHAKSRLSATVDQQDADVAIRLTKYYLMQVGYDPETKTFDIDRFSSKISSNKRNKVILLKETLKRMEEKFGKQIPMEEIRKELPDLTDLEFEDAIEKLKKSGDVFQPKQGFLQDVQSR
ncbi:minichromosome maintenance protein MCM [Candidatus Pacearchaeota archaeon]|nr:minichromosome maintenance protein MCM [Candidatus Pacearchaeota archaeon]